jgi:hypothetical protein
MRWSVIVLVVAACDLPPLPGMNGTPPDGADPYAASTSTIVVEVDVQPNAEPFTGQTVYGDTWDLTVENIGALVGDDKTLDIPRDLADMGGLDGVPEGDLDSNEILALASAHQDEPGDDETAAYHVLFVDRFFEQDGERRSNVLGVSIGDSRVIAMFKPVIGDGGALLIGDGVDRFVEQTTMMHELGHALGLVDNGMAMKVEHKDEQNGAHCDNDRCVMFFLNEGFNDAVSFARDALVRGDRILFDDNCLDDAAAARSE